jgi:hypothetical protein
MTDVLDHLVEELQAFADADPSAGGIAGIVDIQSVQKGDPGWLHADEYPYLMIQAGTINPKMETLGRRVGYYSLNHDYTISIMVDATDYFDPASSGNDAEGPLEDAALALWKWFMRAANRQLEPLERVRQVTVGSVDFLPDERGEVYARRALLVLTVERQYQHQP